MNLLQTKKLFDKLLYNETKNLSSVLCCCKRVKSGKIEKLYLCEIITFGVYNSTEESSTEKQAFYLALLRVGEHRFLLVATMVPSVFLQTKIEMLYNCERTNLDITRIEKLYLCVT